MTKKTAIEAEILTHVKYLREADEQQRDRIDSLAQFVDEKINHLEAKLNEDHHTLSSKFDKHITDNVKETSAFKKTLTRVTTTVMIYVPVATAWLSGLSYLVYEMFKRFGG